MSVFTSLRPVDLSLGLNAPIPLGPEDLLHGTLPNGMRYYVRKCAKPKSRVAVGLAVCVGSAVEEDHEQGVAHILEHMAFNSTENYSNHAIVKFLESIGAAFGACQNAYTSPDETVFLLTVPSDKPKLLDDALSVVSEFACRIRCTPDALTRERGPVFEEYRSHRDAAGRQAMAHWQLLFKGSRYADRLPIGTEANIKNVAADTVRAFYERWYRPENMAIVVVGDFETPDAVLTTIRQHLGVVTSRSITPARPVPTFTYMPHAEPRCSAFVDKEVQEPKVWVSFKHPARRNSTPAQYLAHLQEQMFHTALGNRLFKMTHDQDRCFVDASASVEPLCATTDSYTLTGSAVEGGTLQTLEALLKEVARVRLHGFSAREIARAKADIIAIIESTYLERDQGYCWDLRDEYIRHFLLGEFVTGQDYEARLSKTLLPMVKKEDVEAVAQRYHPSHSCVVKTVEHRRTVSEEQIRDVCARVVAAEAAASIAPWQDGDLPAALLAVQPLPGAVTAERSFPVLDAFELKLANGMRVCVKSTAFMEDEVLVTGFARGGLSQVPRELYFTSFLSLLIARHLGVFGFKPQVLSEMLAGKRVDLDLAQGAYQRKLNGVQSPVDLETAFQLIHLLFTTDIKVDDEKELAVVLRQVKQNVEAQQRNPLHRYHNRIRLVNYNCYHFEPLTVEDVDKVDSHVACAWHNSNFRNPAEFTIVFTGNVTRESVMPLVTTYLASLPATSIPAPISLSQVTPLEFSFPKEPVIEDVHVPMVNSITQTQITFPVSLPRPTIYEDRVWVQLACSLLETKLLQRLRFEFGEIYTVTVMPFFGLFCPSDLGDARGDVSISFTCDPLARHRLTEISLETLDDLQNKGPTAEEVATLLTLERLQFEECQAENSYWHDIMVQGYQSRSFEQLGDLDAVHSLNMGGRNRVLAAISPETIRDAMLRLFPYPCRSRYTSLSMVPSRPGVLGAVHDAVHWAVRAVASSTSTQRWVLGGTAVVVGALAAMYAYRSWWPGTSGTTEATSSGTPASSGSSRAPQPPASLLAVAALSGNRAGSVTPGGTTAGAGGTAGWTSTTGAAVGAASSS